MAKFIVTKHQDVDKNLLYEGMRIGVDRAKYQIRLPLPKKD